MNRFLLNLTILLTIVILAGCSADVSINTAENDSDPEGTIPTAAAVDSSETITDSETITGNAVLTDSMMMTETTDAVTTDAAATATPVSVTLDATAVPTNTDGTTTGGATLTVTETVTDTTTVTDTETTDTETTDTETTDTETTDTETTDTETTDTETTDTGAMTTTAASMSAMTELPDTSNMTVAEVVESLDAFSTLATVVNTLGITDALAVPGPITVFAPVNEAFAVIPDEQLQGLLADPELLTGILQYHIVIDAADSAELARLNAAQSTSGEPLAITVGLDGEVFVNEAQIVFADIPVSNGVIHVINQVLVPPAIGLSLPVADPATIALMSDADDETLEALKAEDTSDMTVVEVIGSIRGLSTAATAVDAAGLADVLEQPGPFTLFIPTNPAFDQLPDNQLADLLNDSAALADVLQYHLVLDTVTSGDLATLPSLLNAAGDNLTVTVEDDGQIFINNAPVYQIDIEASNGIIHVVGEVITPVPEQ